MTGRWMMAAIQTSFAVMPALVYWFAGFTIAQGNATITIGTLVAFTTLQTRLFFPIGSLLGCSSRCRARSRSSTGSSSTSTTAWTSSRARATLERPRGEVRLDSVWFRYDDAAWTLAGRLVRGRAGDEDRARRGDRLREDDVRVPRRAALRRDARAASPSTASTCAS